MQKSNANKKALPFPAENASKKPSADIRYLTPFGRSAQMLFCHVFCLHSSAFLIFFCITIIENLHLPSAEPKTDSLLHCIGKYAGWDYRNWRSRQGRTPPFNKCLFLGNVPFDGLRERICFLPRNIEPWMAG